MFSYALGANPTIDYPRLLISDTQASGHVFEDEEIQSAFILQTLQFQSAQFFSGPGGQNLPSSPVSYLRVAALLLDCLAADKSRLGSVTQLLDVTLDPNKAAASLREQAKSYRDTDDNAGAFAIIEQCNTSWAFTDRYWKTVQRQVGV